MRKYQLRQEQVTKYLQMRKETESETEKRRKQMEDSRSADAIMRKTKVQFLKEQWNK